MNEIFDYLATRTSKEKILQIKKDNKNVVEEKQNNLSANCKVQSAKWTLPSVSLGPDSL